MARHRARGEAGQLAVRDRDRVRELVGERPEARAEHEPETRPEAGRPLRDDRGGVARAHPRFSGPNENGSSSATEVVRRTRSMSARYTGVSWSANSRRRWRPPPATMFP